MINVEKALFNWARKLEDKNEQYTNDDFNPLQLACAIGSEDVVNYLMDEGACEVNLKKPESFSPMKLAPTSIDSTAVPKISPLQLAVYSGNIELISTLTAKADINYQDQMGFTALHYATIRRNKNIVLLLLDLGASAIIQSKLGTTALDIAKELNYDDVTDILQSKTNRETDPLLPQFKEWLLSLGGSEYLNAFIEAGYDLSFISKYGLSEEDLDSIPIPPNKRGLRRKLVELYKLDEFYEGEEEDEDDEEDDEDDEDEDDDEEDEDE